MISTEGAGIGFFTKNAVDATALPAQSWVWDSAGVGVDDLYRWCGRTRKAGWKPALRFGGRVWVRFNGGWGGRSNAAFCRSSATIAGRTFWMAASHRGLNRLVGWRADEKRGRATLAPAVHGADSASSLVRVSRAPRSRRRRGARRRCR